MEPVTTVYWLAAARRRRWSVGLLVVSLSKINTWTKDDRFCITYVRRDDDDLEAMSTLALVRCCLFLDFLSPDRALDLGDGWGRA